jgi:mono/diheme cytochrome c family protein
MDAMRLYLEASILLLAAMAAFLTCVALTAAQNATAPGEEKFDVSQLFATTCGFCHSDGGRAPGRGPQLMNSPRDDDFLRDRIKNGKSGAMPAFATTFTDMQVDEIIRYIRALKPHQGRNDRSVSGNTA